MVARWPGATVVIIASGPSLTIDDCETVRQWREAVGGRCIAINMNYRRAPWADVLYACDGDWWRLKNSAGTTNLEDARDIFRGELWTQDEATAKEFGLNHVVSKRAEGLSKMPGIIHQGFNGGFQAINLAYLWGATRIVLLGYDMSDHKGKTHWHKPYAHIARTPYENCLQEFKRLAIDLAAAGVAVVNCTRRTALHHFPMADLDHELARPMLMAAD